MPADKAVDDQGTNARHLAPTGRSCGLVDDDRILAAGDLLAFGSLIARRDRYTQVAGTLALRQAIAEKLQRENRLDYSVRDIVVTNSKTDPDAGPKGITAFIVEKGFKGLSYGSKLYRLGMRGSNTYPLFFDDCEVPLENVVGGVARCARMRPARSSTPTRGRRGWPARRSRCWAATATSASTRRRACDATPSCTKLGPALPWRMLIDRELFSKTM